MNQEQNNLNPNNFNTQGNNGMPNNQPLQNNQGFNPTFNQNVAPNTNVNQSTFNSQPMVEPISPVQPQQMPSYQQPIIQERAPQSINNTVESGNKSNQNFNSKQPKKMNIGLIVGIVVAVAVVGVGIVFGSKLLSNGNINNDNNINRNEIKDDNSITNNKNNNKTIIYNNIKIKIGTGDLVGLGTSVADFIQQTGIEFKDRGYGNFEEDDKYNNGTWDEARLFYKDRPIGQAKFINTYNVEKNFKDCKLIYFSIENISEDIKIYYSGKKLETRQDVLDTIGQSYEESYGPLNYINSYNASSADFVPNQNFKFEFLFDKESKTKIESIAIGVKNFQ